MLKVLVAILIRQANRNAPDDPAGWLESLQATKWANLNAQNGQITGTSVNGKSVYLSTPPGASLADILTAAELALQCVERGLSGPPGKTQARQN
jgi:hypothetical protein